MSRSRTGGATAFSRVDADGEISGDLHVTGDAVVDNMLTTRNLTVTHYWQSSDSRLKTPTTESPVSAPDGTVCPRLAARLLLRLPARTYFMQTLGSPEGKCHIGHFAQEVRDLLPTAVREDPSTARLSLNYNELHVLGTCVAADAWKRVHYLEQVLAFVVVVLALCVAAVACVALKLLLLTDALTPPSPVGAMWSGATHAFPLLSAWHPRDLQVNGRANNGNAFDVVQNMCSVPVEFASDSLVVLASEPFATPRGSTIVTSFDQPYFCAS